MLKPILNSDNAERVLVFLISQKKGYAREIARFFDADPDSIQKQLVKFEEGGVLISRQEGRTLIYELNPRYPFRPELVALMEKALMFYPESERDRLIKDRRRPRRKGKPYESDQ
jgi:DNA-binding transcriptional ArsR family regulator